MALTPGTRIGVFQLIDLIGRGGMGEVYRARDTKLDRHVAIKVLPEAFAARSEDARLAESPEHRDRSRDSNRRVTFTPS